MKADIEERISTTPLPYSRKAKMSLWQEIALGIFIGGLGLLIVNALFNAISRHIIIQGLNTATKKLERQIEQDAEEYKQRQLEFYKNQLNK